MAKVKPFQFNKENYEETHDIYIGILSSLGIENPEQFLEAKIAEIPEDERNGLMFNGIVASLFENQDKRKEMAKIALNNAKQKEGISPYIIGYLAEMSDEYIPFDTVLTAGTMVGSGKSLQMGCGEGKTGVLSMAAYAKLQEENKQIFLTSSTPILAAEALDKLKFYENVGMADKVTLITPNGIKKANIDEKTGRLMLDKKGKPELITIDFNETNADGTKKYSEEQIKKMLEEAYKSPLVSSDNATLMQHAMKGYLPKPEAGIDRELLADEADFVLLDSYRPMQQTEELTVEEQDARLEQRKAAYDILKGVLGQKGLYEIDEANQYVDFTNSGREAIVKAINDRFASIPNIDKNQIYDYVYDALVVETVYRENRDYQILNNGKKIVSEDRTSGVGIDLPEGVKQALEIKLRSEGKYRGEISPERKVLDTLNVQSFFQEYFNGKKHFVSGTLGLDSEEIVAELGKNFSINKDEGDIYEIPPKGEGRRDDQGKTMFSNGQDKRNAIINNALEEIEKGRPVLIGTISEEEIIGLKKELESRGLEDKMPRVLEYTAASEGIFKEDKENLTQEEFETKYGVKKEEYKDYASFIKIEAGKKDTITLGTSIIGRGTTIKTSDKVNKDGGIHVILDGLHETSSRNQEQYKARTARGSNAGSTKEFFSLEDIPEEYRDEFIDQIDAPDKVYREVYKKIDVRTSNIRRYVVEFVQYTRQQLETIEQDPDLSHEQKSEIKCLVATRAFSIKNRACGVSDKFIENVEEYKKEITAYQEMYSARYKQQDIEFSEEKWLKENGYEDLARMYIPFSKEREKQIFTLSGIKSQAEQARQESVKHCTEETKQTVQGEKSRQSYANDGKEGEERDD